jgi:hypothetical protein
MVVRAIGQLISKEAQGMEKEEEEGLRRNRFSSGEPEKKGERKAQIIKQ